MDLSEKLIPTGAEMELTSPKTGAPVGLVFKFHPLDTPALKQAQRAYADKRSALSAKGRSATSAEVENFTKSYITTAVSGWEWTNPETNWKGEQPEYSPRVLGEMLEMDEIREQIAEFLTDKKNFFLA